MNPEEIKVGDKVLVEAEVNDIHSDGDISCFTQCRNLNGDIARYAFFALASNVRRIAPAPEPAPSEASHAGASAQAGKYDPCRKFRKGDKVRLVEWQGRPPFDCENYEPETAGQLCIVAEDEDAESAHYLHVWKIEDMASEPDEGERPWLAFPIFSLELITPVEELEPYSVHEGNYEGEWGVYRDWAIETQKLIALFYPTCPHAKEAAEAERDRLNEANRKEQE